MNIISNNTGSYCEASDNSPGAYLILHAVRGVGGRMGGGCLFKMMHQLRALCLTYRLQNVDNIFQIP